MGVRNSVETLPTFSPEQLHGPFPGAANARMIELLALIRVKHNHGPSRAALDPTQWQDYSDQDAAQLLEDVFAEFAYTDDLLPETTLLSLQAMLEHVRRDHREHFDATEAATIVEHGEAAVAYMNEHIQRAYGRRAAALTGVLSGRDLWLVVSPYPRNADTPFEQWAAPLIGVEAVHAGFAHALRPVVDMDGSMGLIAGAEIEGVFIPEY